MRRMGQLEQIWSDAAAEVHQIVVGPMDNNVYILRCQRYGRGHAHRRGQRARGPARRSAATWACNQVVETHGHWDHIQAVPAVRDAGISVAVTSADAAMLPSYDLILEDDESSRSATSGSAPWPRRATPRAPSASPSRAPTCCSPATRSSRAARATPRSRAGTSTRSSRPSTAGSSPEFDARHARPARTRGLHHGRRAKPPTCRNGSTAAGEGRRNGSGGTGRRPVRKT